MSLNATTQSVVINSLNPGGRYTARVAAQTAGGLGPYSVPAALHMDPSFISRPPKLVYILILYLYLLYYSIGMEFGCKVVLGAKCCNSIIVYHKLLIDFFLSNRTDPAAGAWATTWMSGVALAILVISLISGAIFALYWARKNKRNMKTSYPGKSCFIWDFIQINFYKK